MEWTTAASLVIRTGKQGYENRHSIQRYWTILKAHLDRGDTQVVITGHAGAGKSVLAAQMHGRARDLAFEIPGESTQVEVDAIQLGDWTKLVRVLPGQSGSRTAGEIQTFQQNKSLDGVIHVVDFGYVAPRDPVIAQSMIDDDKIDTIEKLRSRNLRLEAEDLKVLLADINKLNDSCKRPRWLIIAVNKIDLFMAERNEALKHYHPNGNSDFSRMLSQFQKEIGSKNFGIYIVPVCAYETDFSWNNTTQVTGLDAREHHAMLREFVKSVALITEAHDG